jgi:hypothetical protein
MTSCAVLSELLLCHTEGNVRLHRLTVNRWYPENQEYYMQVRGDVSDAECFSFHYVDKMIKNTFSRFENEFYFIFEECKNPAAERSFIKKCGGVQNASRVLRYRIDCANIKCSPKFEVKLPKERILAFRQYTQDDFVILQKTQYLVGKNVGDTIINS